MKALVVGYGSIGKRHIDNLSLFSNLEILVCTKHNYDDFLRKRKCKIFNSLEQCLDQKPDIGIIANVTSMHVKTAMKLANAGVNLFIEKPLSNSMIGISNLLEVIDKKKIITLMGCVLRFHPCIIKIKRIISNNEIGRVISVHVENGSFLPDWHQYEDYRKSYAARQDLGGGVVLTNIHEIDYLHWFFGDISEVFSITGKYSNLDLNVDDLSSMLLKFKKGVVGEVHLDFFQRPNIRSCKIAGTKGTIHWDIKTNIVSVYDTKRKKWLTKLKLQNYDENKMYVNEMSHFIECVKKNRDTINNIKEGIKILEIALAIKKAGKINKPVILG